MLVRRSSQIDKGYFFVSLKKLVFFFFLKMRIVEKKDIVGK